ncbi:MAG TPA: 5'-3' exonuclease H3TH domain-containing protein [Actinomycetota bacterium]|nr:5'-3' exonuclease H3TH domain-containing protein [Actinomycetota bacterium]
MKVHLLDGTYELFRHHFAVPSHLTDDGMEVAAVRGVLRSVLWMLDEGVTHLGVATDHVIESFRNDLWAGYKSSAGIEPALLAQFPLLEDALREAGVVVWAMVDQEADDGLASAAAVAAGDPEVEQVLICTPDKDLAQCVSGTRVVQVDRRKKQERDEPGVWERFGVGPASIPDYLALVGDSADGFPGLPGWGARSASTVLAKFGRLEDIPPDGAQWGLALRNASTLAAVLNQGRELALLFKDIATLRTEPRVVDSVEELRWTGPRPGFPALCERLGEPNLVRKAEAVASRR